ncbi:MAG: DUF4157 domain-containing protein [Symploca sp. SIO2E9]|nr:DUF4157 domain-containing protein [Symploca sp. SIO2E9]
MTRQYDVRRSSQSPKKDADNWILQRTAVRSLPAKTVTSQTKSPAGDRSSINLDLMQIPVSNYSAIPSPLQTVAQSDRKTPLQRQEEEKKTENNTGLPDRLKEGIESMSGFDLSGVRVNYNSPKPARVNAHAYTQGQAIEVAPGQERHLAHEAWHVVQQMQGRVRPTMQMKGGVKVNDDAGLEKEANVMGKKAQFLFNNVMSVQSKAYPKSPKSVHVSPPIQRNGEKAQPPMVAKEPSWMYKTGLFFNTLANMPDHNQLATGVAKHTGFLMGFSKLTMAHREYQKTGQLNKEILTNTTAGLSYITEGIGESFHLADTPIKPLHPNLLKIAPLAGAVADFSQIPKYIDEKDYISTAMYGSLGSANLMMLKPHPGLPKKLALGFGLGLFILKEVKPYIQQQIQARNQEKAS